LTLVGRKEKDIPGPGTNVSESSVLSSDILTYKELRFQPQ
jgi:hypothetical protein